MCNNRDSARIKKDNTHPQCIAVFTSAGLGTGAVKGGKGSTGGGGGREHIARRPGKCIISCSRLFATSHHTSYAGSMTRVTQMEVRISFSSVVSQG